MKPIFALAMLILSPLQVCAAMNVAEGHASNFTQTAPATDRVARYTSGPMNSAASVQKSSKPGASGKVHGKGSRSAEKTLRAASPLMSQRASHLYFYDVGSLLLADRDGDQYHSEFRIRFDVDSMLGDTLVYARLYLRRIGEVDWTLYHTTEDFWIDGQSDADDYYVITTLDDGFATAQYDVLIDIHEPGFSGIAATIGPYDSPALSYLPLEEVGLDVPIELPGYAIHDVRTTLLIDSDRDGFYSSFDIEFDPDANLGGGFVYAVVWVRPQGGSWIEEHVSDDFLVDASGSADTYGFTADWISGYPTAYYDVQIDLYEAATGLLVASAGSERAELSRIPLEDQSRDIRIDPPGSGSGGSSTSSGHGGGGALSWSALIGLLMIAMGRLVRAGYRGRNRAT